MYGAKKSLIPMSLFYPNIKFLTGVHMQTWKNMITIALMDINDHQCISVVQRVKHRKTTLTICNRGTYLT
jgi:hypothetical protein